MITPFQKKPDPETIWYITDRWFRMLEIGLILGVLSYFKIKTNNFLVVSFYWISWIVFWAWFVELGESVAEKISLKKSAGGKWLIWFICICLALLFWALTTSTTQWVVQQQFK